MNENFDFALPERKVDQNKNKSMSESSPLVKLTNRTLGLNNEEPWVNGIEFAGTEDMNDWDELISRGTGVHSVSRWDRESLFQKFDPLVSRRSSIQVQKTENTPNLLVQAETVPREETDGGKQLFNISESSYKTCLDDTYGSKSSFLTSEFGIPSSQSSPAKEYNLYNECSDSNSKDVDCSKSSSSADDCTIDQRHHQLNVALQKSGLEAGDDLTASSDLKLKAQEPVVVPISLQAKKYAIKLAKQDEIIRALQEQIQHLDNEYQEKVTKEKRLVENAENKLLSLSSEINKLEADVVRSQEETDLVVIHHQQAKDDLNKMEEAFASVLVTYETGKEIHKNLEKNENVLKAREPILLDKLAKKEQQLGHMKKIVEDVMESIKIEQDAKIKEMEAENKKLKAKLRLVEMNCNHLEAEIQHTQVESEKLRSLCNEMIKN